MLDFMPPTETDGPLGAMAIARTLIRLGKEVVIATDECNEEVLLACAAGSGLASSPNFSLESFAGGANFDEDDLMRMRNLANRADVIVAIERAGPCADGAYRTMRGLNFPPY